MEPRQSRTLIDSGDSRTMYEGGLYRHNIIASSVQKGGGGGRELSRIFFGVQFKDTLLIKINN